MSLRGDDRPAYVPMDPVMGGIRLPPKPPAERIALVVVPAPEGGWVVKEHDPCKYNTALLFAGDAEATVRFLAGRLT
jgi:hypothetical protein